MSDMVPNNETSVQSTAADSTTSLNWYQRQQLEGQAVAQARVYILNEYVKYCQAGIPTTQPTHTDNESIEDYNIRVRRYERQQQLSTAVNTLSSCYTKAAITIGIAGIAGFLLGRVSTKHLRSQYTRNLIPAMTSISLMYGTAQVTYHQCDLGYLNTDQPIAREGREICKSVAPHMQFDTTS